MAKYRFHRPGQTPPPLRTLETSKPFVQKALEMSIDNVLDESKRIYSIPLTVANMAGVALGREGDAVSKSVVWGAYTDTIQLLEPVTAELGTDAARGIIRTEKTLSSLATVALGLNFKGVRKIIDEYSRFGKYFEYSEEGIRIVDWTLFEDSKYAAKKGGCPVVRKDNRSIVFDKLVMRAGNTYTRAVDRGMPRTRTEQARRAFDKLLK